MQKIATDIYTFSELRTKGFTYVDKTAILWELANGSLGKQFFIARPRRFGKSLAVSTLRALFEGRRELFAGLAVDSLEWDWETRYPVLHLDMGSVQVDSEKELAARWRTLLSREAERNDIAFRDDPDAATAFENVILDLAAQSQTGQMVLLVDEYDKPLLGKLGKPEAGLFRDTLKRFYSVIKTLESKQRFSFMTGVSRFSKVSIFSDLNNLKDLTMNARVATLFGYTHEEVQACFSQGIHELAVANKMDDEGAFAEIVKWYDGYRFHPKAEPVINPVSLGSCLQDREFNNYWSMTATPTFLLDALRKYPLDFSRIDVDEFRLGALEPECPEIVTLLFQAGYLTIGGFSQEGMLRRYTLKFPNQEVESAFLTQLLPVYTGVGSTRSWDAQSAAVRALRMGDIEKFVSVLKSIFADVPYDLTDRQNEQTWQAILYVVLRSIGMNVNAEVRTNSGRIDMVAETPVSVWIIEVKRDKPSTEAINQIRAKKDYEKYQFSGKTVKLVGISFSTEKRTVVEHRAEFL